VREAVRTLAAAEPNRFVLADSRERIAEFREVCIKPNGAECIRAMQVDDVVEAARRMSERTARAVFATIGADGIILAQPGTEVQRIPGYPVTGAVDPVGAGDCANAAIATAIAAGL